MRELLYDFHNVSGDCRLQKRKAFGLQAQYEAICFALALVLRIKKHLGKRN